MTERNESTNTKISVQETAASSGSRPASPAAADTAAPSPLSARGAAHRSFMRRQSRLALLAAPFLRAPPGVRRDSKSRRTRPVLSTRVADASKTVLVAALAVAEETRNITIIWYLAACDGSAPAIICPDIIPGIHCFCYERRSFFFGGGGRETNKERKQVSFYLPPSRSLVFHLRKEKVET